MQDREIVILLSDLVKKLQQSSSSGGSGVAGGESARGRGTSRSAAPTAALPHLEVLLTSLVEGEVRAAKEVAAAAAAAIGDGSAAAAAPVSSRVSGVITSESFARLLDMFTGDRKPPLTRTLLTALCSMPGTITDPVVVNT